LKAALLAVSRSGGGRDSLTKDWDGEFVYGFVEAADSDYDVVRSVTEGVKK